MVPSGIPETCSAHPAPAETVSSPPSAGMSPPRRPRPTRDLSTPDPSAGCRQVRTVSESAGPYPARSPAASETPGKCGRGNGDLHVRADPLSRVLTMHARVPGEEQVEKRIRARFIHRPQRCGVVFGTVFGAVFVLLSSPTVVSVSRAFSASRVVRAN